MRLRRKKLGFIRILLLRRSIDILALTETWLDETWNDFQLTVPGYNLFRDPSGVTNAVFGMSSSGIVILPISLAKVRICLR